MDSHRVDSHLRRLGATAKRLGVDRVPGTRAAFRRLRGRIGARPTSIDHHGFELHFTPAVAPWSAGSDEFPIEPAVDAALRRLASDGDVVVDVGGFLGYHALALRRAVGANGRVIVFEPHPETAELLERTIDANGFENVALERVAVGAAAESTALSVPEASRSMSSTVTTYESATEVDVETVPLPRYLDAAGIDRVALAKIDIEGGEYDVLCESDALDRLDALVCEIHPHALGPDEIEAIVARLRATGTVTDLGGNPLREEDIDGATHAVWLAGRSRA